MKNICTMFNNVMRHSFSCKEFLYINHDLIRLRDSSVLSHTLVASRTPTKQTWYIATSQAYKHTEADRDSRLHTALSNTQVRTRKTTRTDTSAVKTECGGTVTMLKVNAFEFTQIQAD